MHPDLKWLLDKTVLFLAKFAPTGEPLEYGDVPYSSAYHQEIARLLEKYAARVVVSRTPSDLLKDKLTTDMVFSLFNRIPCVDGEVFASAVCAYRKIPIVGSTPHMRAIAEDKHLAKLMANRAGLRTPAWTIHRQAPAEPTFPGPYFVKPRFGAASDGISRQCLHQEWKCAIQYAHAQAETLGDQLIEEFVPGKNITQPILGGCTPQLLPPVEVQSQSVHNIITKTEKFTPSQTGEYALLRGNNKVLITTLGRQFAANLDPFDYTRLDFRICEKTQEPYFLEFNLCCDISSMSSFIFSAKASGLSQSDVIETVLRSCLWRYQAFG